MNKKHLILAAAVALFTACASDEDLNSFESTSQNEVGAIKFGFDLQRMHRAEHKGADAAALLGNNFVIYGAKSTNATGDDEFADTKVFDHYNVNWVANSAGTSESNTADWEYVNQTKHANSSASEQTIKYWDYATTQYDFIAYSTGGATESNTAAADDTLKVTAITPSTAKSSAYTVEGIKAADLGNFYVADIVTVPQANYGNEVRLTFRNLTSKVRLAMYETVPGYSVKDVKFYPSESGTPATTAHLYGGTDAFNEAGTYKVYYPTIGSTKASETDYNKAHLSFTAGTSGTSTVKTFTALSNLVGKEKSEEDATQYIGRSAPAASYTYSTAANDKGYLVVLPNETGVVLNMKCDYTLVSIDGSGETIKVTGATAQVPQIYAAWKSGYAYTYIFKISDKTNGSTGIPGTNPAGLYPITFDAVVTETEDGKQETITTVETPSITTYQKGTNGLDEYKKAGDIYVMVHNGATLCNDLDSKGQLYTVDVTGMNSSTLLSEASVADALNVGPTVSGTTTTGRNGIALTEATSDATITAIPGEDGNDITVTAKTAAKFTAAAGTYAYVYEVADGTDTEINTAVVPANDTDVSSGYYTDFACTVAATGTANGTTTYYQKVTLANKTLSVKVIKVQ